MQSALVFALPPTWNIIPTESTLSFTATQNNAPVSGQFKTFNGDIVFDPSDLAHSKIKIIVDLNSVTTSYKEVGDTLKTPDWFQVKVFPNATFDATQFKKTGDNTFEANGQLTIRDKTLPVTLTFTLDEYSASKAHAKGQTTIQRNNFGVGQGEWSSTNEIKNDVKIEFNISATKK
jgi:polyisoprenoid-binding protein YceI